MDESRVMETEQLRQRTQEIVERYGPWTAHNIRLTDDLYTIGPRVVGDEAKLRRITQVVSDIAGKPLTDLRVLDLKSRGFRKIHRHEFRRTFA